MYSWYGGIFGVCCLFDPDKPCRWYTTTEFYVFFFFQAEDGIRDWSVTGVRRVLFRSGDLGQKSAPKKRLHPKDGKEPCRRSEERRVGKECRSRWSAHHEKKKKQDESSPSKSPRHTQANDHAKQRTGLEA